jgi:hypothetical protein
LQSRLPFLLMQVIWGATTEKGHVRDIAQIGAVNNGN